MFNYQIFNANLKTEFIGHNIKYFDCLKSTNEEAWKLIKQQSNNGTIVITKNQTKGKGRRANRWFSTKNKSLTFSIILYPNQNNSSNDLLSLISGIAIIEGIKSCTNISCGLKWPNDVMLNQKKIAGILIESKKQCVVIGVGINVNDDINDIHKDIKEISTSLKIHNIRTTDIELLLAHILNEFEFYLNKKNDDIIEKWMEQCVHMGQLIKYHNEESMIMGDFKGLNKYGHGIINIRGENKIISGGIIHL